MSEIPTISVTKDEDDLNDYADENGDFDVSGLSGALTDLEDLDSIDEGDVGKHFLGYNNNTNGSCSNQATDIEDYNDSCSDDEVSENYPVLMLSLQEFLSQGISEERTSNNRIEGKCEFKAGNFLGLEEYANIDDCPTENDNYSLSSDEENFEKKSVCVDFSLMHLDNDNTEAHVENVQDSDEEFSRSDCIDYFDEAGAGCVSENEIFEMSGNEEEIQIAVSSSDDEDSIPEKYPTIGVTFTSDKRKSKKQCATSSTGYLKVAANVEDPLTDIEKIDLSAAEDSGDDDLIPIARAVVLDSTDNSITDVEDMMNSEATKYSDEIENLSLHHLPLPHREMVLIREDKNGDPITNVQAMENDFLFGLNEPNQDDFLTDIEDISGMIDDISDMSTREITDFGQTAENEIVRSSDNVKMLTVKRNEYLENLTDTEEIFVTGSVRRKKNKSKTQNKLKSKQPNLCVFKNKAVDELESDESTISSRSLDSREYSKKKGHTHNLLLGSNVTKNPDSADLINESYTVVHEKCASMFNVQQEKNFIKGLKECLETHTDVEYVEEDQFSN